MSAQFGRCNFDGRPVDVLYLDRVAAQLSGYGPDGQTSHVENNIALLYFAFHSTEESRREAQPQVTETGDVILWDGVLDNRDELERQMGLPDSMACTDLSIVAATWARWGTNCFAKLIGDWALTIWKSSERTVFLAKDYVGTRHLYYYVRRNDLTWSTVLDPLIAQAGCRFELEPDYLAGWLAHFPAAHLTPFKGVNAVPPASYLQIRNGEISLKKYWDFDPRLAIRYRTDGEYEAHFRNLVETSVRRRLRSDGPVLAELSGGMDSSSIVCVADRLVASGRATRTRIDTVSYYQEGEPAWNESPYIAVIETMRGRTGCHIDVSHHTLLNYQYDPHCPEPTPVSRGIKSEAVQKLARCITSNGNRVVLSGLGGDEVLGGAPGLIPQLADLLAAGRFAALVKQAKAWALSDRTTVIALLAEIARTFLPASLAGSCRGAQPVPWLDRRFMAAHRAAFCRYQTPFSLYRTKPSFQEKLETFDALRRQLATCVQIPSMLYENRYPYLDRDLVEFLFAIPSEQLQRPGERRSLMRRALVGIVPDELLNRRRKAFIARQALMDIMSHWSAYRELVENSILVEMHIIDRDRLITALEDARSGNIIPLPPLAHAVVLEKWLRHIRPHGFLPSLRPCLSSGEARDWRAREHSISAENT